MNRKGVSGKAIAIVIILVLLLAAVFYFMSQKDASESSGDSEELDDFGEAIDSTGNIDSELGLDEDFDYGLE